MEVGVLMSATASKYSEMKMENVYKVYGSLLALKDCSFDVAKGKMTCLVGPSGCGKSTIINLLAGHVKSDGGKVLMDGEPVGPPGPDKLVVFQEAALMPWKTLMENTAFGPLIQKKLSVEEVTKRAQDLINKSGLTGFENKYPFQLSGGMQRRAELIRALINEPKVMLMDEPLRGVDAMTREILQAYVIKLYEETKMTALFITTEIDEAIYLGDVIYFLTPRPGRVKVRMDIDIPRPRTYHTLTSKRFFELKAKAIDIVMEEASTQLA